MTVIRFILLKCIAHPTSVIKLTRPHAISNLSLFTTEAWEWCEQIALTVRYSIKRCLWTSLPRIQDRSAPSWKLKMGSNFRNLNSWICQKIYWVKNKQHTYCPSHVYFDFLVIQSSRHPHPLCVAEFGEANLHSKIFTCTINGIPLKHRDVVTVKNGIKLQ